MARFRKVTEEIDAVQYLRNDNDAEVRAFFGAEYDLCFLYDPTTDRRYIPTIGGRIFVRMGDWIIREKSGEYRPCESSVFERTYEPIETTIPLPQS